MVVRPSTRRRAIGRRLYQRVETAARAARARVLCAEVNIRPPNSASLRFHETLGFVEIGRQDTGGGAKTVVLLTKDLMAR